MRALYRDKEADGYFSATSTRTRDFLQDFADNLSLLDSHPGRYLSGAGNPSRRHQQTDLTICVRASRRACVQRKRNSKTYY